MASNTNNAKNANSANSADMVRAVSAVNIQHPPVKNIEQFAQRMNDIPPPYDRTRELDITNQLASPSRRVFGSRDGLPADPPYVLPASSPRKPSLGKRMAKSVENISHRALGKRPAHDNPDRPVKRGLGHRVVKSVGESAKTFGRQVARTVTYPCGAPSLRSFATADDRGESSGGVRSLATIFHSNRGDRSSQLLAGDNNESFYYGDENTEVEVEVEVDSACGSDVSSSTESLDSTLFDLVMENGRGYHRHKDGKYLLPSDSTERNRLDLQHLLFAETFSHPLGFSPAVEKNSRVQRVLDVGTGTGEWAIDFADKHPDAEVIGVDLAPIQKLSGPPNVTWQVDDLDEDWTFKRPFDLIHSRAMSGALGDWPKFIRQAYDNLAPGGWLELHDIEWVLHHVHTMRPVEGPLAGWTDGLQFGYNKHGTPLQLTANLTEMICDAGFIDVCVRHFQFPANYDPYFASFCARRMHLGIEHTRQMLEAATMRSFTVDLEWTEQEVHAYLDYIRALLWPQQKGMYWPVVAIVAKKPLDA